MDLRKLARTGAKLAGALALLAFAFPQASLASGYAVAPAPAQPPMNLTVQITDAGFDSQTYTASTIPWPSPNNGTVTFKNVGSRVHTATFEPGTNGYGARWLSHTDAAGNSVTCFSTGSVFVLGCGTLGNLDTGGIEPGGAVTMSFSNGFGAFSITSATDCLGGSTKTGFNCAPVTLNEVPTMPDPLAVYYPGSVFGPAGSPDCVKTIIGSPACFTATRKYQTVAGTPDSPLDGVTVNIDDVKGFQPTVVYIKAGSTVTWVNKGTRVHSVGTYGPGYWQFSGNIDHGIGPGESYSHTFGCNAGPNGTCAGVSEAIASKVRDDLVNPDQSGIAGPNNGVCFTGLQYLCGVPGMDSEIFTVPSQA